MDYRPQQPGEHDFVYAARILRACATGFDAMLANGSYSAAELQDMRTRLVNLAARTQVYPPAAYGSDAAHVRLPDKPPAAASAPAETPVPPSAILAHTISVEGKSRPHAERLMAEAFNEWTAAHPAAEVFHIFEPVRRDERYADYNYDRFHSYFTFFYREAARGESGQ